MINRAKNYLESWMLGNLHVQFGVGAVGQFHGLHHTGGGRYKILDASMRERDYVFEIGEALKIAVAEKQAGGV